MKPETPGGVGPELARGLWFLQDGAATTKVAPYIRLNRCGNVGRLAGVAPRCSVRRSEARGLKHRAPGQEP